MLITILSFILSLVVGGLFVVLTVRLRDQGRLRTAESEAADMMTDANDRAAEIMDDAKNRMTDFEERQWAQHEAEIAELQAKVDAQEQSYRAKRSQGDRGFNADQREIQKQMSLLNEREKKTESRGQSYAAKKTSYETLRQEFIAGLQKIAALDPDELKQQLVATHENELQIEAKKKANAYEESVRADAEDTAKRIINIVFNRFGRASSVERGLGIVEIENEDQKFKIMGVDRRNFQAIENAFGVDLTISESGQVQISGFDPVRREMTSRCLEKVLKEKDSVLAQYPQGMERLIETTKREVITKIEKDGRAIAGELGMNDLHQEVKNTLGSLRYRYSFAQNQFHHVGEVGWICGLLASELQSVETKSARRAGLLHDIGKAMDHSIEGGHAVIGADFIKQHGEKEHIVHAVRAHHYEEQPSSDLAFLVIAADAISGSRPGARRSTVSSYNQKIEALSTIAEGFKGVTRTMVFNAGREVRVTVDARRINDQQSLKLCRDIADKIENECAYPGQIKVVVVRETHASSAAK